VVDKIEGQDVGSPPDKGGVPFNSSPYEGGGYRWGWRAEGKFLTLPFIPSPLREGKQENKGRGFGFSP